MKTDFTSLKEIHEYYAVNNNCKLKETATQPVYEIVPPSSGILLIGEAPGRNEDLQGRPFVGAAGKFLNELLNAIDYTREDVYVSNVVKYRPPQNRDPNDEEKDSCRVWLNAELLFIKPRVIVTLGRHALGKFAPDASISASHGEVFEHQTGIPIFAMYHPAAALYNPNLKEIMKEDFLKLKKFLDNLKPIDPEKRKEIDNILKL
ncbi:MAG: uracil-DNA glycosylase [Candidatus Dojkabacteria bacterium]